MKRLTAIALILCLMLSFGACAKKIKTLTDENGNEYVKYEPSDDATTAFYGVKFINEKDETNTIVFAMEGNTFIEYYKDGSFNGTWEYDAETDIMSLTYDGASYSYNFNIGRDADNMITGLTQYGGRNFKMA